MSNKNGRREFGGDSHSRKIGETIVRADNRIQEFGNDDVRLMSLTVQTPWKRGDGYLVIGRIETGGQSYVAFHSSDVLYEALRGFFDRFNDSTLELKEDQYA